MMPATMHPRDIILAMVVIVVWGVNFAVIKGGLFG
jgi:O-acetylserine/cysteine efflux transporter